MKPFSIMLKTEGKLSIRNMNMIIFALLMPIVILIVIGILYGSSPAYKGAAYTFLEQSFGALCSIAICAGGLMGLPIVISEYREQKILKRFQVTPVSPLMILIVQLCIYTLYAAVSVLTLWIVARIFWGFQMRGAAGTFLISWGLVLLSILSIGMLVGGVAKNSKIASVLASLLYFPMLVFSGATLPYEAMPETMQKIIDVFPLTQGIKLLKAAVLGQKIANVQLSVLILLGTAALCIALSVKYFKWE